MSDDVDLGPLEPNVIPFPEKELKAIYDRMLRDVMKTLVKHMAKQPSDSQRCAAVLEDVASSAHELIREMDDKPTKTRKEKLRDEERYGQGGGLGMGYGGMQTAGLYDKAISVFEKYMEVAMAQLNKGKKPEIEQDDPIDGWEGAPPTPPFASVSPVTLEAEYEGVAE